MDDGDNIAYTNATTYITMIMVMTHAGSDPCCHLPRNVPAHVSYTYSPFV